MDPDPDLDRRRGGARVWDEGGGVISEDDACCGEQKPPFLSDKLPLRSRIGLRSGDAERLDRRGGVLGMRISAAGAKEACDRTSES